VLEADRSVADVAVGSLVVVPVLGDGVKLDSSTVAGSVAGGGGT
jgi:hypothetical protein